MHRIGGNGFCGTSRTTLLKILGAPRAFARRRHQVPVRGRPDEADGARRRPRGGGRRHQFAHPRGVRGQVQAEHRAAAQSLRLDGLDQAARRLQLLSSARPSTASSSRTAISTSPAARPGSSRPIPRRSSAPASPRSTRRAPPRFMEEVFAEELDGHKLITNRSIWRNFPTIRCERWTARQHRADRRRQGDRAFLDRLGHQARDGGRDRALRGVPRDRRPRRARPRWRASKRSAATRWRSTQHSADVSLVWFEHVKRFWDMDPTRFAFGLMTRSQRHHLRQPRAARAGVRRARPTRWWRARCRRRASPADVAAAGRADVPAVPAARHDAAQPRGGVADVPVLGAIDGLPGDWHMVHYGSRAIGGAGLMFTEMTCVAADARITHGCTGMYNDAQEAAWKRIVDFVHAQFGGEDLPAARPRRPQGRDQADVGGHGPAAAGRRLADRLGLAAALLSRTARCRAR